MTLEKPLLQPARIGFGVGEARRPLALPNASAPAWLLRGGASRGGASGGGPHARPGLTEIGAHEAVVGVRGAGAGECLAGLVKEHVLAGLRAGGDVQGPGQPEGGGAARGQARGPPPGDTGPALSPRTAAFPLPSVLGSVMWTQGHQEPHSVRFWSLIWR